MPFCPVCLHSRCKNHLEGWAFVTTTLVAILGACGVVFCFII